jgi:DNA-binding MarR family transcriptional regulator
MPDRPLPFDPIAEARRQWEQRWGEGPAPAMAAVTSVMRCQQILMSGLNELLRPFSLTFPRYEVLMLVYFSRQGALPLGKIGQRLQVHRTSVTGLVDRLEADGLLERAAHESDRRTTLAQITARGRRVAQEATEVLNGELFCLPGSSREQLEEIVALMRAVRVQAGDFDVDGPDGDPGGRAPNTAGQHVDESRAGDPRATQKTGVSE